MMNDKGEKLTVAPPATPVEVLGFNEVPSAGETFTAVDEKLSKQIVEERSRNQSLQSVNYRELTAKVSEARSYTRFWSKMMNGGVVHGLLRADMQEHIPSDVKKSNPCCSPK